MGTIPSEVEGVRTIVISFRNIAKNVYKKCGPVKSLSILACIFYILPPSLKRQIIVRVARTHNQGQHFLIFSEDATYKCFNIFSFFSLFFFLTIFHKQSAQLDGLSRYLESPIGGHTS